MRLKTVYNGAISDHNPPRYFDDLNLSRIVRQETLQDLDCDVTPVI